MLRGEVHQEEKGRKLLPEDVQKLRYLASTNTFTQGDLAERFDISQGEVSRIVSGQLYADVPASAEEQAQIARLSAISETVDREYARMMANIPVEGLPGGQPGNLSECRLKTAPTYQG